MVAGRPAGWTGPARSRAARPPLLAAALALSAGAAPAAERLSVSEEAPESLEGRGLLPELEVRGLRLTRHFRLGSPSDSDDDWTIADTRVPADYQAVGGRRLPIGDPSTLDDLSTVPFGQYITPRQRVRAAAALNAAAMSPATYNATYLLSQWRQVYDEQQQFFYSEQALAAENITGNSSLLRAEKDVEALTQEGTEVRAAAGADKFRDLFKGLRGSECPDATATSPPCRRDIGLALSVYEDATHKVVVFHSNWDTSEFDYMNWAHKIWILEKFELSLNLMWSLQAQQPATEEMSERARGKYEDGESASAERTIRCAYKDYAYKPAPDPDALAIAAQLTAADVENKGLWKVVQQLVRMDGVIPEGGEKVKTVILTGTGRGGSLAALVSLWLKRLEGTALQTYVFAPDGGWQCLARRLYKDDMTPHDDHSHIVVYSHVMDAFAGAVDRVAGKKCLYGANNFTGVVKEFCSKIVGHTGPQLLFRHASGPPEPSEKVKMARKYFDACHYFTHSVWYAAVLMLDDEVLDVDGSTDGGCRTEAVVPQDDRLQECPLETQAEVDCDLEASAMQELPLTAMIAVGGGLFGLIVCTACLGYCMLRRVRNESWLFNGLKASSKAKDKAQQAALKARQARERKNDKEARKIQKQKDKILGGARKREESQELKGEPLGATDPEMLGQSDQLLEEGRATELQPTPEESKDDAGDVAVAEEGSLGRRKRRKEKREKKEKKSKGGDASDHPNQSDADDTKE